MSRAWTWRHAIMDSGLSATTKHVLFVISCHMNDIGEGCYPSTKLLAEKCSLSERSVCTHIEIAEEAGWLVVERHGFSGQKWARHEYRPAWPEGTESGAKTKKGTEPLSKGTELHAEGTEPDALHIDNIPENIPKNIPTPHTPKGAGVSDDDLDFWKVVEAFTQVCPSRVDRQRAWSVWNEQGLKSHSQQIIEALPSFAALDQWRKEGGKYIPSLSKWLADGAWRAQGSVSLQARKDELREREKIIKKGMDAFARLESDRKLGLESSPEDLAACRAWRALEGKA